MFYKTIIFDLDNTIYDYNLCNNYALKCVFERISELTNEDESLISDTYNICDNKHKSQTFHTTSSHNKGIKIKYTLEHYNINYTHFEFIYNLYWTSFFKKIVPFDGVTEFIKWNKKRGIKIGILTDYEMEFQIQKLYKLNLLEYIDCIVTSEEIGCEKPNPIAFKEILGRMNSHNENTIMIGDDFKKDILGANACNIYGIHYQKTNHLHSTQIRLNYSICSSYRVLTDTFLRVNNTLVELVNLSKQLGHSFNLVQAGGGNISIKTDNMMLVKASGIHISDITECDNYVVLENELLMNDVKNGIKKQLHAYQYFNNGKGSMESYMHCILNKYVIHLHILQLNRILISSDAHSQLKMLFPDSIILDYITPGFPISQELLRTTDVCASPIIFLKNHGVIIHSNNLEDIYTYLTELQEKIHSGCSSPEKKVGRFITDSIVQYKIHDILYHIFKKRWYVYSSFHSFVIEYLSDDIRRKFFTERITTPDIYIYCGPKPLVCDDMSLETAIHNFVSETSSVPVIMMLFNTLEDRWGIYIVGHNIHNCKEIEDVLVTSLLTNDIDSTDNSHKTYLSVKDINILKNCNDEKYRKKLIKH